MKAGLVLAMSTLAGCGGSTAISAPMAVVGSVVPTPPPSTSAPEVPVATRVATRIEAFYAQATPFECELEVETLLKVYDIRKTASVHVVFERPGRLHVAMTGGSFLLVEAGVQTLFDPQSNRLSQEPVASDHCPIALAYAAGSGELARHFGLLAYTGASMNAPGYDVLVGTPLAPSPAFTRLVFYVAPTGEVRRSVFVEPSGNRQRYDIVSCTRRMTPPASLFAFTPPSSAVPTPPPPPSIFTTSMP